MKWNPTNISCFYVGLIVVCFGMGTAKSQTPPRPNPRDVVIESNRQELDNLLLRKPILTTEDNSARQAVLKQINEDFKALQVLNNRVMAAAIGQQQVDYKSLSKLISEIGSKASRLRSNLALPKVESEKRKLSDETLSAAGFKEALSTFDKVVMSFATNPIFQQTNVIELEPAKRASRDLSAIIEQSGKLKKVASRLAKDGQ